MKAAGWVQVTGPLAEPLSVGEAKRAPASETDAEDAPFADYYYGGALLVRGSTWGAPWLRRPGRRTLPHGRAMVCWNCPCRRCKSVAQVQYTTEAGVLTTLAASVYRVVAAHEPAMLVVAPGRIGRPRRSIRGCHCRGVCVRLRHAGGCAGDGETKPCTGWWGTWRREPRGSDDGNVKPAAGADDGALGTGSAARALWNVVGGAAVAYTFEQLAREGVAGYAGGDGVGGHAHLPAGCAARDDGQLCDL